ncbi:hypothetical protein [Marinicella rhabdoformis]|uniref:hypothetical protein n=1 Tax=Marinicella rhabdoformis TaxID=2580566 RepID=UPI0012AEBB3E|nr:hypothetical protein [Marinicella rhabdoformis]
MSKFLTFVLTLFTLPTLAFEEIEVTPRDFKGWAPANVRDDAIVEINKNQPLFGDGSLMFATDTVTNGQDKADFELIWQQSGNNIDFPNRTLGNIENLLFAWYRDSMSTTAPHLVPAFKLQFYDDGGTMGNAADDILGLLIWEPIYNGINPAPSDSWQISTLTEGIFWVYVSQSAGGSGVIQNYSSTLDDWINNNPMGQGGDPNVDLSADTYVFGVQIGVGSGWNNSFTGYVDAVQISFGSGDDKLYNFEACATYVANNNPDVIFNNDFECYKLIP